MRDYRIPVKVLNEECSIADWIDNVIYFINGKFKSQAYQAAGPLSETLNPQLYNWDKCKLLWKKVFPQMS